jgi:hypothetical protein
MISPRLFLDAMVIRAAASCRMIVAMVEKTSAHNNCKRKAAPALEAVVTVPGPIKAAEMIDQNNTPARPRRNEINLGIIRCLTASQGNPKHPVNPDPLWLPL